MYLKSIYESVRHLFFKKQITKCTLEIQFSTFLLSQKPQNLFIIEEIKNYEWLPVLKNNFLKTDVLNKKLQNCLPK
jgi:hypothetical protein